MSASSDHNNEELAPLLADAWGAVERALTGNLSAIRGISYSEYRLLAALDQLGERGASRADLARLTGVTPSAVTRALRPLEKLGMVTTSKSPRDARLAIARLTPAGLEVVADASAVVSDVMVEIEERAPLLRGHRSTITAALAELANP